MPSVQEPLDVFLSSPSSGQGASFASLVASRLREEGLRVFEPREAGSDFRWAEKVRDALAESKAMVIVATPGSLESSWVLFEAGAAFAYGKPVFVVRTDGKPELPGVLREAVVLSLADLGAIREQLEEAETGPSDQEIEILGEEYEAHGLPVDQLFQRPGALRALTTSFARRTGRAVAPEVLLQWLLRARKSGRLPRLRRKIA